MRVQPQVSQPTIDARTVRALANPKVIGPNSFQTARHMFLPLRPQVDGVIKRQGHTEAAIDLARLAGRFPAGVLCELVNDDGTMKRRDDCRARLPQNTI